MVRKPNPKRRRVIRVLCWAAILILARAIDAAKPDVPWWEAILIGGGLGLCADPVANTIADWLDDNDDWPDRFTSFLKTFVSTLASAHAAA